MERRRFDHLISSCSLMSFHITTRSLTFVIARSGKYSIRRIDGMPRSPAVAETPRGITQSRLDFDQLWVAKLEAQCCLAT
jgi:hypothetical protein